MRNEFKNQDRASGRQVLIVMFAFVVFTFLSTFSFSQEWPDKFIDSLAGKYVKSTHNNALIIGVNIHGKEKKYYYGKTEQNGNQLPNDSSIFEIGQLTQVFTSILYAEMTIEGKVSADDKLEKYLPVNVPAPEFQKIVCTPVTKEVILPSSSSNFRKYEFTDFICKPDPTFMAQPILLCFLSTHTSGLPDKPTNLKSDNANPFAEYSKEDLYEFLRIYTIPKNIGYDFRYSSLGIALLGHAMELAAKRKYEDLIIDSVCGKMQMNETRISLSGDQKSRFLNGHKSNGDLAQHWTFDVLAPSGALHSTIRDMMKFLSANTGTSPSLLKDVLDYTHNPRINFHDKEHGEASIGLSWMIQPIGIEERNYVWQSGLTGGFASFIGFVETSKNGIVVLSNSAVEVDKLGEEILRKIEESVEY